MTTKKASGGVGASAHAYEALRTMVLELELAPGTPLAETELSAKLGVSRTPIREALGRLAREGLVRQYPGRGAFVSEISVPDIVELYQMREALESHAARLAAESVDDEARGRLNELLGELVGERAALAAGENARYYALMSKMDEQIVGLAGNRRLAVALSEVWTQIRRARRVASRSPSRLLDSVDEHVAIVTAIRDGETHAAAEETRRHVRRSLANITSSLVDTVV
jgi:GntR family transcriptional regulator, rspAB operon transcriptional repressor